MNLPSAYWFGWMLWAIILCIAVSGLSMFLYGIYLEIKLLCLKMEHRRLVNKRRALESTLTEEELKELNEEP
jgi:hypothetical protein